MHILVPAGIEGEYRQPEPEQEPDKQMRRGGELLEDLEERHRERDTGGLPLLEQTAGDGKVKESRNRLNT